MWAPAHYNGSTAPAVFAYFQIMYPIEVRQTLRRLWKNRGFSLSVVLTLGLGIGATVSVFSIIYSVMIRPLPYNAPARLVSVYQSKIANDEADIDGLSPANFLDFRERNRSSRTWQQSAASITT